MTKSQRMLYVTRFGLAQLRLFFEAETGLTEATRLAYCEAASMLREVQFKECTAVEKRIMSPDSYEAERRFKAMTARWPKRWRARSRHLIYGVLETSDTLTNNTARSSALMRTSGFSLRTR